MPADDPLLDDALVADDPVAPHLDHWSLPDEQATGEAADEEPTTELPRLTEPPVRQPGWLAWLAPWAVFAVVGVVLVAATSTWAAQLRGPTSDDTAARRVAMRPTTTAAPAAPPPPAEPTPTPAPSPTPSPEPEPEFVEREPEPEPYAAPATVPSIPRRSQAPLSASSAPSALVTVSPAPTEGDGETATTVDPAQPPPSAGAAGPDANRAADESAECSTGSSEDCGSEGNEGNEGNDEDAGDGDEDSSTSDEE